MLRTPLTLAVFLVACSPRDGGSIAGEEGNSGGRPPAGSPGGSSGGTDDPIAPGRSDASGGAGGAEELGQTPTVGVFVAQGHAGRTLLSCDGGQTWIADQSQDDDIRCWQDGHDDYLECDHDSGAGRGLVFGSGSFFATFGWGAPGSIRRSTDGASWPPIHTGSTFGGLAFVQGSLVAAARSSLRSTDGGKSWSDPIDTGLAAHNVRRVGQTADHGGRVLLVADGTVDGETVRDHAVSSDGGTSWWRPESIATACGSSLQTEGGIVSGDGVWLIVGGDGVTCRSVDGGVTWTLGDVGADVSSHAVWSGREFLVWSQGQKHASEDGVTWATTPIAPQDLRLGAVASSDAGRLVAVRGGWDVWYEEQKLYWSDDGVTWQEASSYVGGHPIRNIAFGTIAANEECP